MPEMKTWTANGTEYEIVDAAAREAVAAAYSPTNKPSAADVGAVPNTFINGNWKTAGYGTSCWRYEVADTIAMDLPSPCCFVVVMKDGISRGTAIAYDWRTDNYNMWRNTLHDDTGAGNWSGWKSVVDSIGAASMDYVKTISRPNLLDNWYFANCVNQRGQAEYTTPNAYTIDRWMTGGAGTLKIRNQGISYTHLIYQKLEDYVVNAIAGKTVTVSVLTAYNVLATYTGTFFADTNVDVRVNGVNILFGGAIPGHGLNFPTVTFAGDQYLVAAKLELGTEQTLAHQENGVWILNEIPNYADELAKCQRYALFGRIRGVPTNRWSNAVGFAFQTPVTMRGEGGAPSIVGTFRVNCTDGPQVYLNFTVHNTLLTNNDIYVYGTFDSSADAAKATAMYFEPGSGFSMDL